MAEIDETLVALTADIVSAHVSNNSVAVNDLPQLIASIHGALNGLGTPVAEAGPAKREPIMSARAALKPDAITCLVCGARQKTLKRHLARAHGMTPQQYREEFDLKPDYPMVASNYAETRRALAVKIGLGRKRGPRAGAKAAPAGKAGGAKPSAGRGRRKAGAAPASTGADGQGG
jgi:predicted transcriptional regulator